METKANYVAVGAFTVLIFAAAFAFVYWIARTNTGGETAPLRIIIEGSVTGLSNGSLVKFNGIDVGKVDRLGFAADNPRVVIAEAQVRRDLPITEATKAVLSFTGLTGIAHIELEGGAVDQPNVFAVAEERNEIATITADPTPLNDLLATAQDIADRADNILSEVEGFVADARGPLTAAVENVTEISDALAANSGRIDEFLTGMGELGGSLETLAGSLEQTLAGADELIAAVEPDDVRAIVAEVRNFAEDLSTASDDLDALVASARTTLEGLETIGTRVDSSFDQVDALIAAVDPEAVNAAVDGFAQAGEAAQQVVRSVDETVGRAETLLASIDPEEVRAIIADVRGFTGDLDQTTDNVDALLASATRTFEGLENVGSRVEGSFDRVDELFAAVDPESVGTAVEDFAQAGRSAREITSDLEAVTAALEGREDDIDTIFANVTELSERLNAASTRVDGVLARLESFLGEGGEGAETLIAEAGETLRAFRDVAANLDARLDAIGGGLERFSDRGLRDVEALVSDTRRSITRIEQAITSIERDPQRLLFGGEGDVKRFDGRQRR
ncbi:MAG: MlaD family protein [Roseitalea porphyridii]|uniref:MlaD family protein n=1 Tax=Roseitalea porphyridii TaxID=1852022 RepID=UPI0032D918C9